jgi:SAM-dependent methyltransferase
MAMDSLYENTTIIAKRVAAGRHREAIGGLWDEIGGLQIAFLKSRGLLPHHKLLDIGCGSLRGGVHFVPYLDPGNYYGVDLNQSLLDAGYEREIAPAGLADRLPRGNLHCFKDFAVSRIGVTFDVALAQSVFTHVRLERVRDCLTRVAPAIRRGGSFHATYWRAPEDLPPGASHRHFKKLVTFHDRDPYHAKFSELRAAAYGLPWQLEDVGEWNHPRMQQMVTFHRISE